MHSLETKSSRPRPKSFETRPETFETETPKNWSRDVSRDRDQVLRLHHWLLLTVLNQGCRTFCYCRPHYFYLYEVQPPVSLSYIYQIR